MKTNSRKRLGTVIGAVCACTALVASLALFTDRAESTAEYTAGTLDISLTQAWVTDNETAAENFNPGDRLVLNYSLENSGNLDAKVRETFVLTTSKAVTNEFEIYAASDVKQNAETGYWEATGDPIEVRKSEAFGNGTKITYEVPEAVLAAETAEDHALVLLFNKDAKNTIQGTVVEVEYVAQALQDKNTGDNTWTDAKVITEKITIGDNEINVVPQLN